MLTAKSPLHPLREADEGGWEIGLVMRNLKILYVVNMENRMRLFHIILS